MLQNKSRAFFKSWASWSWKLKFVLRLAWIKPDENMWSRIWRIIWSSYFSYIEQDRICSSFNIITLHHMQIHIYLCPMSDRTQIFGSHNVKIKKQDLLRSKKGTYPRIHSNSEVYCLQEKITLEVFFLKWTHFMSRAWPTMLYIWSNPTYVSILGCLCTFVFKVLTNVSALGYPFYISFQGLNPCLSTRLSFW